MAEELSYVSPGPWLLLQEAVIHYMCQASLVRKRLIPVTFLSNNTPSCREKWMSMIPSNHKETLFILTISPQIYVFKVIVHL